MPTSTTGTRPGGFTLLELLVVLVILVLMSGVAMSSMGPALEDARWRAGARIVISALHSARSYAVSHHTDAAAQFDTTRNGVSLFALERDADGARQWRPITTQAGRFRALPPGIRIVDVTAASAPTASGLAEQAITFSPLGQGEDADVTLADPRGRHRTVHVDALTGHCTIRNEDAP